MDGSKTLALGVGFIARGVAGNIEHLSNLILQAMQYKRFSLIDIMQPCVSFNKVSTYEWYKQRIYERDNAIPDSFEKAIALTREGEDKIPVGIFYMKKKQILQIGYRL